LAAGRRARLERGRPPARTGARARRRRPDAQASRRALPGRAQARRLVEVEDRPAHRGCGADLRPVGPRPAQHALHRLHLRAVGRRHAGARGEGLQRPGRRGNPAPGPLDPRQHARALRPCALGTRRARVRTRLRGGQPLDPAQVRHRRALPAHPALAPRQARGRSRSSGHPAGAGAMKSDAPRNRFDAPLTAWFDTRGWRPAPFQREAWRRWRRGESGLLVTPTGSGKTLAALGGPLLDALAETAQARKKRSAQAGRKKSAKAAANARASIAKPSGAARARTVRASKVQATASTRAAFADGPAREDSSAPARSPAATKPEAPRTRLLWITPLRALASDT